MADELIALFGKITTSDHDQLLDQFSKILHVEKNVSQFFLEASSWNVETAVHNYLASVGNGRVDSIIPSSPPQAVGLIQLVAMFHSLMYRYIDVSGRYFYSPE